MGLGIAIGGAIGALTIFVIILTYPMLSENLVEISNAKTTIHDIQNTIEKTNFYIPVMLATSGDSFVNITLSNTGSEKLWNFDEFDVIIKYDADIAGTPTLTIEQPTFASASSFLGSSIQSTSSNTLGRPDSDISQGGWDDNCGGCNNDNVFYEEIDETTRDDSDFLSSALLNILGETDTIEFGLSDVDDPQTSDGHVVTYTYRKDSAGGITVDMTVRLLQGAAQIASWTHANVDETFTLATQTLSTTEADSITDYTDLRLEFNAEYASGVAPFRRGEVSWAEFEVPALTSVMEITCNTSSEFNSGNWIIANITNDYLDPKLINYDETGHVCVQLSNPIFANGNVEFIFSSDNGKTATVSGTAT